MYRSSFFHATDWLSGPNTPWEDENFTFQDIKTRVLLPTSEIYFRLFSVTVDLRFAFSCMYVSYTIEDHLNKLFLGK